MSAYARYREKVSLEEENDKVSQMCEEVCRANRRQISLCAPSSKLQAFFDFPDPQNSPQKFSEGAKQRDYECWRASPYLRLGQMPLNYRGDEYAKEVGEGPCLKCRQKARARLQMQGAVTPDKRFWVGAAAAGTGLFLTLIVSQIRQIRKRS